SSCTFTNIYSHSILSHLSFSPLPLHHLCFSPLLYLAFPYSTSITRYLFPPGYPEDTTTYISGGDGGGSVCANVKVVPASLIHSSVQSQHAAPPPHLIKHDHISRESFVFYKVSELRKMT
ncbi:hypothetical protein OTU49_000942, partial [Cherax quadricarinatus]